MRVRSEETEEKVSSKNFHCKKQKEDLCFGRQILEYVCFRYLLVKGKTIRKDV